VGHPRQQDGSAPTAYESLLSLVLKELVARLWIKDPTPSGRSCPTKNPAFFRGVLGFRLLLQPLPRSPPFRLIIKSRTLGLCGGLDK